MSKRTITSTFAVLLALTIIGVGVLILEPRLADLRLSYDYVTSQMFRDVSSLTNANIESDEKWKEAGPTEYKKRLMSIDPNIRLDAIRTIEEKSDPQYIPQMVKLLNDGTSIVGGQPSGAIQISEAAKKALIKLIKDNIVREPGNVAQLLLLFQAVLNGSFPEKLGVIDILSDLREPTAYPLLKGLSENKDDHQIAARASKALRFLIPDAVIAPDYYLVTSRRVQFMYLLMASGFILTIAAILGLLGRKCTQFAVLCLLAIVVDVGLGVLVHAELNRGTLTQKSLQDALNNGDLLALRTMCYSDNTPYPGDSFFCQEVVKIGGVRTVLALIKIAGIEPDDLLYLKTNFEVRKRWIMARIVALNLGSASLDSIINDPNPDVGYAMGETLDQLRVQDKQIGGYLERLSQSANERVRETTEKALSQLKDRPIWSFY